MLDKQGEFEPSDWLDAINGVDLDDSEKDDDDPLEEDLEESEEETAGKQPKPEVANTVE